MVLRGESSAGEDVAWAGYKSRGGLCSRGEGGVRLYAQGVGWCGVLRQLRQGVVVQRAARSAAATVCRDGPECFAEVGAELRRGIGSDLVDGSPDHQGHRWQAIQLG